MPCMNSTSALEIGGSAACVSAGRVFVASPGAPGCTTAGALFAFCAPATATPRHIHAKAPAHAAQARPPGRQNLIQLFFEGKLLIWVLLRYHASQYSGQRIYCFCMQTRPTVASPFVPEMYFGFVFSGALVTDEGCTTPSARLSLEQRGLRRVLKRFDPQTRSPPSRWVFCCTFRAEIHPQFPFSGGRLTENGTAPVQFQSGTESDSRCLLCGSESHSVGQ